MTEKHSTHNGHSEQEDENNPVPKNMARPRNEGVLASIAMQYGRATWDREEKRKNTLMLALAVVAAASSATVSVFALSRPVPTRFIYSDTNGNVRPLIAENMPNMSDADAAAWLSNSLRQAFTFSYTDYANRVTAARELFVNEGSFAQYYDQLKKSGIITLVTQEYDNLDAKVVNAPFLNNSGVVNGKYTWHFIVPIALKFHSENQLHDREMTFNMSVSVTRVSEAFSKSGLGISSFYYEHN